MKERQADKMEKRQEKLKALGINLDFAQMVKFLYLFRQIFN